MAKSKGRWWKWLLGIVAALVVFVFVGLWIASVPMPEGVTGPEADQLAEKMMDAVNHEAWDTTEAVSWTFNALEPHQHLWDKKRHLAKVCWSNHEVLVDINKKTGVAYTMGGQIDGKEGEKMVETAWKYWVNDAFWLNPVVKAFDPGTSRSVVTTDEGEKALMVSYSSGGFTPGDSYLWFLDENGLPYKWKMWVKVLPIGGLESSWEEWVTLDSGAKVASMHKLGSVANPIEDIKGGTLAEVAPGPDPFAALMK
ncbi:MAG: hypothetical protein AAGM67_06070 [Bacteroidota bacterium]